MYGGQIKMRPGANMEVKKKTLSGHLLFRLILMAMPTVSIMMQMATHNHPIQ
jgi:hypothetical protein